MPSAGLRFGLLLVRHQLVMRVSLDFGSKSLSVEEEERKKIDWRFSLFTFKDGVVSSGRKGAGPAGSAPDGEEVAR